MAGQKHSAPWLRPYVKFSVLVRSSIVIILIRLGHRPPSVPIGFVPQKLGLIWWVPWECKNLGELNFHMEIGKWSTRGTKTAKSVLPYVQVSGELVRIFFRSLLGLWEALFWR